MWTRIRSRIADGAAALFVSSQSTVARMREKLREEKGAMTIEYILIIALIAIIIITLFTILLWPVLRPALEDLITRIKDAIGGGGIK